MGMGFIQLGARVVSMSQTMKDTFLPNVSTIVFFIIFSCSLPSLLDRTLHPKPQMTLTALLEARWSRWVTAFLKTQKASWDEKSALVGITFPVCNPSKAVGDMKSCPRLPFLSPFITPNPFSPMVEAETVRSPAITVGENTLKQLLMLLSALQTSLPRLFSAWKRSLLPGWHQRQARRRGCPEGTPSSVTDVHCKPAAE